MPGKVIDLTTISKGQLVQVIGDQRTSMNELHNRLIQINTLAGVLDDIGLCYPFNREARRCLKQILKLSTPSASTIPEAKDETSSAGKG